MHRVLHMVKHENHDYFKQLGMAIGEVRKEMGLTQDRLAELVGISQSVLAHYETGIRRVPLPVLVQIAEVVQVPLDNLVPQTNKRRPGPVSKIEREFAKVKLLPEKQQQLVIEMIQSVVKHNSPVS